MRVKDGTGPPIVSQVAKLEPRPARNGSDRTLPSATEVDVSLASARAASQVARGERLREIEAAVRNGTYRPDPARIASEILNAAEIDARLRALLVKG